MKRYVLVTLDDERLAEAFIGEVKARDEDELLIADVMLSVVDDKILEEGLPVFSERENQTFKTVVKGAIALLQRAQEIEEDQ